jgi:hypothetical protein
VIFAWNPVVLTLALVMCLAGSVALAVMAVVS